MPCNVCGRMILVSRMNLHLKIHGGFKPHNCNLCSRTFASKSSLNSHVRFNHLGVSIPFICSTCGKTFTHKKTFENQKMLQELNLSKNQIESIDDNSFDCLKDLRVLYLHENQIYK